MPALQSDTSQSEGTDVYILMKFRELLLLICQADFIYHCYMLVPLFKRHLILRKWEN